eukprot:Clim_evm54s156 gene=Clim_evmTU54s156
MVDEQQLVERTNAAEKELRSLRQEFESVAKELKKRGLVLGQTAAGNGTLSLEDVQRQNEKLKYQIKHLQRAIDAEKVKASQKGGAGTNGDAPTGGVKAPLGHSKEAFDPIKSTIRLRATLEDLFQQALYDAYGGIPCQGEIIASVAVSGNPKFGDYQCNSAMKICKVMAGSIEEKKPIDVAKKIMAQVPPNPYIKEMSVAGAGFINVFIKDEFLTKCLDGIYTAGSPQPPLGLLSKSFETTLVDFSSPNIAKDMHVGHLRSTIIGDCICRLFEYLGHRVLRINHVGDWGTQFGMLIAHLKDKFPDFESNVPSISDLTGFYKEAKKRFDEDEPFKKRAYEEVVKLQSGDAGVRRAWMAICEASRNEFNKIYDRLDIKVEERGESFYNDLMADVVKELKGMGSLQEDDGRLVYWTKSHPVPLTVVKSDGGYTYDTSDLAALKYRLNVDKAKNILYVVDMGQNMHLEAVFEAGAEVGWYDPKEIRVEHVGFGLVLGDDGKKFKTRSGETVRLVDLLDEGKTRALAILKEKGRTEELTPEQIEAVTNAVAYGGVKYFDLKTTRNNDYKFSFDAMLDNRGNTATYIIYSYTRIASIAEKAKVTKQQVSAAELRLEHPKEAALAKKLLRYGDVLDQFKRDLKPHVLCDFLYDTANGFTEFYDACRCIEMDKEGNITSVNMSRVKLCEITACTIRAGLQILGIPVVEKM